MTIDFPPVTVKMQGLDQIVLPDMVRVRQKFDTAKLTDIPGHIRQRMCSAVTDKAFYADKRICITCGSRGIPHYAQIIRTIVDQLKAWGARPFLVPAMGSHAGATAEGQREMLAGFGLTEEAMGCPIVSSMDVSPIGTLKDGTVIYCDRNALGADGILVFNKVKVHSRFKAKHESGLLKMMVIGLGKHVGATSMHAQGYDKFPMLLEEGGELFLQNAPVVLGIGLVQNAQDEISDIEVFEKDDIVDGDARLLALSKEKLPRFKFPETDVIILDRFGKDVSGSGFDPNVVARRDVKFPGALRNQIIFCRSISPASHGNGAGLQNCDITTLRCVRSVDWGVTWTNTLTVSTVSRCTIPCFAPNDREALLLAIRCCTPETRSCPRIVRALDTLHLDEIQVSEALAGTLSGREDIEILSDPQPFRFDADGYLID